MKPITLLIALLALGWLAYLACEARCAAKARASLAHVVHVNGTRGKSTVSRLIEAGLRAGGLRVFCKTTGTDPMTIDVEGREEPIHRRGKANIKEQIAILRRAAAQNAQVLVVECMAVHPEYQYAAQHRILKADTVVITNVRRDHTDVMGETLPHVGVQYGAEKRRTVHRRGGPGPPHGRKSGGHGQQLSFRTARRHRAEFRFCREHRPGPGGVRTSWGGPADGPHRHGPL